MNYSEQEIQEAYEKIDDLMKKINSLVEEAEKIADKYSLSFCIDLGTYYGKGYKGDEYYGDEDSEYDGEWVPSQICIG